MSKGDCSICSAAIEVSRAVNDALRKKEKLRDIASRSGFSKSALGRHSQKCLPRVALSSFKTARFGGGRIVVEWPGHSIPRDQLRETDILLKVVYEDGFVGNPNGLKRDGAWTAEAQALFFRRVTPEVQASYVEDEHTDALLENAERDAATQIPVPTVLDNGNGSLN